MSDDNSSKTIILTIIQITQILKINNLYASNRLVRDQVIVIIAILVLGPKEFPIALKKIGSYFGKLKNTLSSFQREVNSVTEDIDIEKDISDRKEKPIKERK